MVAHERNPSHNAPPERVPGSASPSAMGTHPTVRIRTGSNPHQTPQPTNNPSIPRSGTSAGVSIVNGHSGGVS